ncbi:hypothetical protein L6R52_05405 [Myxococcota bacterium]|nr:hypothetical protein [Myxococcota bacterium]
MSAPTPPRRARPGPVPIERAIQARAREFDIPSLLDLLAAEFPRRTVVFRSHFSQAPQPSLVQAVEIGPSQILVTINIGLMTADGPIPSYFQDLFARVGGQAIQNLVGWLDDALLRARLATFRPEASAWLFGDVARVRADLLTIARPATLGSLHAIFSGVFPELLVRVARTELRRAVPIERARLGRPVLGLAAMGGRTRGQVAGFDVVLRTGESRTWGDVSWRTEAWRRVRERVLPLLQETGAHLRVFLVDDEAEGELTIGGDSRLGIDPLARSVRPGITVVFDGCVSSSDGPSDRAFRAPDAQSVP